MSHAPRRHAGAPVSRHDGGVRIDADSAAEHDEMTGWINGLDQAKVTLRKQ